MNQDKHINEQQDAIHPIVLWVLASILFHFLLTVGLITLKFRKMSLPDRISKNQNETFLLMDDPKKQIMPKPVPAAQPQVKQQAQQTTPTQPKEQKPERHWSDYTLVPGRKGIDEQNIDNPADLQNLPTPQNQNTKPKQAEKPKNDTKPSEKTKEKDLSKNSTNEEPEKIKKLHSLPDTMMLDEQNTNKKSSTTKDHKTSQPSKPRTAPQDQNPYEFVPTPNRTISFKDLHLGFDPQYQTIGNNANLIQAGKTFDSPDPIALKHLTYYNQCAGMMKTAFATHSQVRLRPYATGKRFHFAITVNRNGNLLNFRVINGSGDQVLDKIISESVQTVTLFPKLPNFIIEEPFTMTWIFLH